MEILTDDYKRRKKEMTRRPKSRKKKVPRAGTVTPMTSPTRTVKKIAGASEAATRKEKRDRKRAKAKVKRKEKRTVRREKVKEKAGAVLLQPLKLFRPAMRKNLDAKGIQTKSMSFGTLVETFFNENISKKKNQSSTFEPVARGFITDSYCMKQDYDDPNLDHFAAGTISMVVDAVVQFFKKKRDEKKTLEERGVDPATVMSKEDLEMAKETEVVVKQLEDKEKKDIEVKRGDMSKIAVYAVVVIVIIGIFYFISKKK